MGRLLDRTLIHRLVILAALLLLDRLLQVLYQLLLLSRRQTMIILARYGPH